jgi:hypothetical protein
MNFFDFESKVGDNEFLISPSGIRWQCKRPYFVNYVHLQTNQIDDATYRQTPFEANSDGWTIEETLHELVGKIICKIYISEQYLIFHIDDGSKFGYMADADCCSQSVFYDFLGVKKLLKNNPVISTKQLPLKGFCYQDKEWKKDRCKLQEYVLIYGYEIVTCDEKFGEVTSVFSFRNYSNGGYGGNLHRLTKENMENMKCLNTLIVDDYHSSVF